MPATTSETRFQGLHETGHAVVAHALGYSVDSITLTDREPTVRGYVSFRNPTAIPPSVLTQHEGPLKYELMARTTSIAILLAGKTAECRFAGRDESRGWAADAHEVQLEIKAIVAVAKNWENREGELLHICQTLAESVLEKNAEDVRRVSEALIAKGSLSVGDLEPLLSNVTVDEMSFKSFQYAVLDDL